LRDGLARAEELLDLAALARLADAPAITLSGGQRMLLQACAGFMIPGLEIYVLEEPFAGINPVVKDTLISLIMHENRELNITFLIGFVHA
jgi:ABC-type branched-subunit amino acid transport system ATPase component